MTLSCWKSALQAGKSSYASWRDLARRDTSWHVLARTPRPGASWRVMARPDASWRILTRQEAPRRARTCCQPGLVLDHPGSSWICLDQLGSSWIILDYPGPAWTCSGSSWIIMDQPGRVLDHPGSASSGNLIVKSTMFSSMHGTLFQLNLSHMDFLMVPLQSTAAGQLILISHKTRAQTN